MPYDLRNDDGELDRGKVNAELRALVSQLPIPHTPICVLVTRQVTNRIIDLIDEAIDAAFADGEDSVKEILP